MTKDIVTSDTPQVDIAAMQAQIAQLQAQLVQAQNPSADPLVEQRTALEAEISALQVTYGRYIQLFPLHTSIAELTAQRDRMKAAVDTFEKLHGKR